MRKLAALAIAVIVIGVSVGAHACGDDSGSAKKVDASKTEAKATQASVKVQDANVKTAQYHDKANDCSAYKEAKAKTADAKVKSADSVRPASTGCPAPCKNNAQDIKAKTVDAGKSEATVAMAPKAEEKNK